MNPRSQVLAGSVSVVFLASLLLNIPASAFGPSAPKPSSSLARISPTEVKQDKKKPAAGGSGQNQRIGVLTVRLPVVIKKNNKFVGGLSESNFQVYEDGKLQKIDTFQSPSPLPLDVAVLMDTSESVKLKLPFEKDAAEDFVSEITTYKRKDRVLFVTFDTNIELHQDFTTQDEPLVSSIRKVKAGGYTRLYDAVCRVIEEKMAGLQGSDARPVIVILSDGADTASQHNLKDALEMAERYDVTIFAITTKNITGITSGTVESADDKELRRLCEESGGQLFLPSQKIDLVRAFNQVANDLRSEYVLFYTPPNQEHTGKHRAIRVKLVGADGHSYYKSGYTY